LEGFAAMMKTTWQWLEGYVQSGLSAEDVADRLTMSGTEVEVFEPVGDDVCYTLEVTSNRTDCLSAIGLARELAACTARTVRMPEVAFTPATEHASAVSSVEITPDALHACPYYTGHIIRGIKVGPSPKWLQKRLEGIGLKPINNIVDITNFVLFETGQPLHAFDLARLNGRRIVVRMAKDGERFDPLIDRKRDKPEPEREYLKLTPDTLVIADAEAPQAVGGVMGGLTSGVTEATTEILLESAYFDPASIRATSRRIEIESDSSYRFERGVDPAGVIPAARRAVQLILEIAGGEVLDGVLEAGSISPQTRDLTVSETDVERVMGVRVSRDEMRGILTGLGLGAEAAGDTGLRVSVPSFRRDLERTIDLVEEIGRVHGLDKVPVTLNLPVASAKPTRRQRVRRIIGEALRGAGCHEALTDTFVGGSGVLADFSAFPDHGLRIAARNPVNARAPMLRGSLAGSMLAVLAHNQRHGAPGVRLYEIANVFLPDGETAGEREVVGVLGPDYFTVKGAVETLLEVLHCDARLEVKPLQSPLFADGRGAALSLGDTPLGAAGEVSAAALKAAGAEGPCALAELDLSALADAWTEVPVMAELPRFPVAERDLAFVLDAATPWAEVERTVREACDATLRGVELFDEFTGKQLGAGRKSLAFRLYFRHDERTLTHEEITKQMNTAAQAVTKHLNGTLRA
jgi:phenylalanyl-tRNA synthetase beta chain